MLLQIIFIMIIALNLDHPHQNYLLLLAKIQIILNSLVIHLTQIIHLQNLRPILHYLLHLDLVDLIQTILKIHPIHLQVLD